MTASQLLYPALAFVLVLLVGVVLMLACRGADIARAIQANRYAKLERQSEERALCIRTDRHLWEARLAQAEREQMERSRQKRQALNAWQREYSGY